MQFLIESPRQRRVSPSLRQTATDENTIIKSDADKI